MLATEITVPAEAFDFTDAKYRLWADLDVLPKSRWNVRARFGVRVVTTRNDAFNGVALGSEAALFPGYYRPRWAVTAELIVSWDWASRFQASSFARSQGATTAAVWAAFPEVGVEAGVRAGYSIGPVELSLRAGFDRRGIYSLAVPPVYALLGVSVRFTRHNAPITR
jgi:hypothetical protein